MVNDQKRINTNVDLNESSAKKKKTSSTSSSSSDNDVFASANLSANIDFAASDTSTASTGSEVNADDVTALSDPEDLTVNEAASAGNDGCDDVALLDKSKQYDAEDQEQPLHVLDQAKDNAGNWFYSLFQTVWTKELVD